MTRYILFHAKSVEPFRPCMDGLFAAFVAQSTCPDAQLIPAVYGQPPALKLVAGDTVYLLDLSYPAHVLEGWADTGAKVTIIDHHKTALNDLSGLSSRVLKTFDMARSGAVLAWEHFVPKLDVPRLYRYVQDRDLWTKSLPDCDLVSLGLAEVMRDRTLEDCLSLIEELDLNDVRPLIEIGRLAEVEVEAAIKAALSRSTKRIVAGDLVPFVRVQTDRERQAYSEIGHRLVMQNSKAPFACVETSEGWALRSGDDRADVSKIAKTLGGGGHCNAAGCRSGNPETWVN